MKPLPKIIGLTGRKYAGKTEAAKYLEQKYGYTGSPITDPMIEMARPLLKRMGIEDEDEINDRLQPWGKRKEDAIPAFPHLSGRKILQAIGKDLRDALSKPTDNPPEGNEHGTDSAFFYNLWLKDNEGSEYLANQSVRYEFEGGFVTGSEGVMWRIINPEAPDDGDTHPSERQDWPVTREIVAPHSKGVAYLHEQIELALAEA